MSQGSLLTILTAPHGGAKDGGIFFVVECVAIPIHWMVEKREVPAEEGKGSERAGLGLALVQPSSSQGALCWWGNLSFGIVHKNVAPLPSHFLSVEMNRLLSGADKP